MVVLMTEERLVEIGMESLEARREWLDMVQTYKIVKEVDNVDRTHWFTMRGEEGSHGTRATQGGLNIIGKRSKLEVRRNFYSQRVVDNWNGLSKETKLAKTVAEFKWRLRTEKKHWCENQDQKKEEYEQWPRTVLNLKWWLRIRIRMRMD